MSAYLPGLGFIEPCLPSPAKAPPSGPGWLHEIKHDGFRILPRRDSVKELNMTALQGWIVIGLLVLILLE
jgi:hypothetical protein